MNKIRWSQVEKNMIAYEIRRLYPSKSHLTTVALVTEAQKVLPKDRQRKLTTIQQVAWVDKLRQQIMKEFAAEQAAEASYVPIKDRPIFVEELATPNIHPIVSQLSDLLSEVIVQLVNESISKARTKLDLGPVVPCQVTVEDNPPLKEHKDEKPKILVYGLMSAQKQVVNKAVGDCFNIRYLKDASSTVIKSGVERADSVYVMTKFIKHDEYNHLKKGGKVVHVNGGITDLVTMLEERYLNEASS